MRLRHVEAFWTRVVGELDDSGLAEALVDADAGIFGAGDGLTAPHVSALDVRTAAGTASVLLFVSVLVQPLVYAHVNGFTVVGIIPPARSTRPAAMKMVQEFCQAAWRGARVLAFLVGEYASGARLFTAPADFAPPEADVCRTRAQRLRLLAAGATFIWCTLSALADTAAYDSAARSLLATQAFVKPLDQLADAARLTGVGDPIQFVTGVTRATSIIQRPILNSENSPSAWRALATSTEWDAKLLSLLAEAAGDALLDGCWAEVVRPFPVDDIPPHLLENLPDFSDGRLDVLPMPAVFTPYRLPWVPLPPQQPSLPADAPACPRIHDCYLPEARDRVATWLQAQLEDLLSIREQLKQGVLPTDVQRGHRPRPMAVGDNERPAWARGLVLDCRGECCTPLDFEAQFSSQPTLPGVSVKRISGPGAPVLSDAGRPTGGGCGAAVGLHTASHIAPSWLSVPVEKEIRRLEKLNWYDFFDSMPFSPAYYNGQGAIARKLEPDRFRRSTEGGGARVPTFDASGLQAIAINAASHIHHSISCEAVSALISDKDAVSALFYCETPCFRGRSNCFASFVGLRHVHVKTPGFVHMHV